MKHYPHAAAITTKITLKMTASNPS